MVSITRERTEMSAGRVSIPQETAGSRCFAPPPSGPARHDSENEPSMVIGYGCRYVFGPLREKRRAACFG